MDTLRALSDRVEGASWWMAVALLLVVAAYESLRPDKQYKLATLSRWLVHFALYAGCLALVFAAAPERFARLIHDTEEPHAVFAVIGDLGGGVAILLFGCLAIDLLIYITHRVHHRFFILWRFHAVHHADTEMDLTTTLRHHPLEFLANGIYVAVSCAVLGMPVWVVPFYAALSMAVGQFQHMNGRIAPRLDAALRWVIVTPAMHRAHHSMSAEHHNCNFGSVFSLWDRLLGTHLVLPAREQAELSYGVRDATSPRFAGLRGALLLPLNLSNAADPAPDPIYHPGD